MKKFLAKDIAGFKVYEILATLLFSLILIIVGSAADLSISSKVATLGNGYGKFIDAIGGVPFFSLVGASGILFFLYLKHSADKEMRVLGWVILFLFPLAAGAYYGYDVWRDFVSTIPAVIIGVVIIYAIDAGLYFLFRKADPEIARKTAIIFLIGSAVVFLAVFACKYLMNRPRYLFLVDTAEGGSLSFYKNWWQSGKEIKTQFPDLPSSYFSSFPSGHSAFAAGAISMAYIPLLNDKLKGKRNWFFYGDIAFAIMVGLGRLLDGSHFLSDIGFAFLFGFGFVYLVAYFVYRPKKEVKKAADNVMSVKKIDTDYPSSPLDDKAGSKSKDDVTL